MAENIFVVGLEFDDNAFNRQVKKLRKEVKRLKKELTGLGKKAKATGKALPKKRVKGFGDQLRFSTKNLAKLGVGMVGFTAVVGGLTAGFDALVSVTQKSIQAFREYEKELLTLSAITGAAGKDLEEIGKTADETASTFDELGVNVLKATTLIASAKPELLENAKALGELTAQTLVLAKAQGLDLVSATEAVTTSLNQFNASADQGAKFINVLAAGSKFGSSVVRDTALAIREAGAASQFANSSFEELNAAIQLLAKFGFKGSRAGTALRSIYAKVAKQAAESGRSIKDLTSELKLMGDKSEDVEFLTKRFGEEFFGMAQILIKNTDLLAKLEGQLTGTSTAVKQAQINSRSLDAAFGRLESSTDALFRKLGESEMTTDLVRTLAFAIDSLTGSIDGASTSAAGLIDIFKKYTPLKGIIEGMEGVAKRIKFISLFSQADKEFKIAQAMRTEVDKVADSAALAARETQRLDAQFNASFTSANKLFTSLQTPAENLKAKIESVRKEQEAFNTTFFKSNDETRAAKRDSFTKINQKFNESIKRLTASQKGLNKELKVEKIVIGETLNPWTKLNDLIHNARLNASGTGSAMAALGVEFKEQRITISDYIAEVERLSKLERNRAEINDLEEGMTLARDIINDTITPLQQYQMELERLQNLAPATSQGVRDVAHAIGLTKQAIDDINNEDLIEGLQRVGDEFQNLAENSIFSILQGEAVDFGKSVKRIFDKMVAEWIAAQLKMKLMSFLSGAAESGGSGGFFSTVLSAIGSTSGGGQKSSGGGGSVSGGIGAIASTVFAGGGKMAAAGAGGGGGAVTVHMNITTPDIDSFNKSKNRLAVDMQQLAGRAMQRSGKGNRTN